MATRAYTVCGIEIGKESLCIVQYVPSENAITNVAIQLIETARGPWWDNVQAELKGLVSAMKLGGEDVVCCIPSEHAVIKRLVADGNDMNPEETLEWELGQNVIGLPDEYVFDYQRVGERGTHPATYLVAAYRTAAIERLSKTLASHKLNPLVYDLDMFAMENIFEYNYKELLSSPALLVLGGDEYTKIVLSFEGEFIDYECFRNDADVMDPARYAATISRSALRLQELNPLHGEKRTPRIFVTGPLFTRDEFCSQCLQRLGQAEVLFPFKKLACRTISDVDQQKYSAHLAIAAGLALRGNPDL
jgi:Tfp pilus assembly PilM family ATPase